MSIQIKRAAASALIAAGALASMAGLPSAAAAQTYYEQRSYDDCAAQQSGNTVGGAIVGGLAGGLIGHSLAERGSRGVGTAVGAGVGAAIGAGVGSSSTRCANGYDYQRSYDYDRTYNYDRTYDNGDYGRSYYDRSYATPTYPDYDRSYSYDDDSYGPN